MPAKGELKERRSLPRELHEKVEGLEREAGIAPPPTKPAKSHHFLVAVDWRGNLNKAFSGHSRAECRRAIREAAEYAMAHPTGDGKAMVLGLPFKGCEKVCTCCRMECGCFKMTVTMSVPAGVKELSMGPIDGYGKSWDIENMREEAKA